MTTPVIERQTPDQVRHLLRMRTADRVTALRARPYIRIWDKNWILRSVFYGETAAKFAEIMNDAGEGELTMFGIHPLRKWLIEELALEEDVHITVDNPGKRWHGKALTISERGEESGVEYITIKFLHGYEHAKKITCYSNPLLPPQFQWPKSYMWAGPSIFGIKTMLFLNLMRRYGPTWQLPDNIWDAPTWQERLDPGTWGQVVIPSGLITDTSMWTVMVTRWGNFHDVTLPVRQDAGLQLVPYRWLPGDAQPAPSHFTLTKPTLVWDVIDRSGVRGPSGTLLDGLLHLGSTVMEDGINESISILDLPNPPQYSQPGFMGTLQDYPWVAWRRGQRSDLSGINKGGLSGIISWEMTIHKALAGAITTGGKSPSYINAGVKLLLNGVLGYIGLIFGNPALALGIFDKQVEDVILAFIRVPNSLRQAMMGNDSYGEHWEAGGQSGFSVSTLQAVRIGFWNTRAYTSFRVKVRNGAPYWVGRHFDVGSRVAAEVGNSGNLYVDQVHSLTQSWNRTQNPTWEISIGDDSEEQQPTAKLWRQVEQMRAMLQALGVES